MKGYPRVASWEGRARDLLLVFCFELSCLVFFILSYNTLFSLSCTVLLCCVLLYPILCYVLQSVCILFTCIAMDMHVSKCVVHVMHVCCFTVL